MKQLWKILLWMYLAHAGWAQDGRGSASSAPNPTARISRSIVLVQSQGTNVNGSGFVWPDTNHIVTAYHVVAGASTVLVSYDDGVNLIPATLVKIFPPSDLALLEVEGNRTDLEPIKIASSRPPAWSDIWVYGYPWDTAPTRYPSKGSVTDQGGERAVRTLDRLLNNVAIRRQLTQLGYPSLEAEIVLISCWLKPGLSGAPVVNQDGELIGIANGGLDGGLSNVQWAAPAAALESLRASTQVRRETAPEYALAKVLFGNELNATRSDSRNVGGLRVTKLRTRTVAELLRFSDERFNDDPAGFQMAVNALSVDLQRAQIPEAIMTWSYDIYNVQRTTAAADAPGATIVVPAGSILSQGASPADITVNTGSGSVVWQVRVEQADGHAEINSKTIAFEANLMSQAYPYTYWQPVLAWTYHNASNPMIMEPKIWPSGLLVMRAAKLGWYQNIQNAQLTVTYAHYRSTLLSAGSFHRVYVPQRPGDWIARAKFILATLASGIPDAAAMQGQAQQRPL